MIVSMKKIFLLTQNKDAGSALDALHKFGAVHIEHEHKPTGGQINELKEKVRDLEKAISILSSEKERPDQITVENGEKQAKEILALVELIDQLKEEMAKRETQIKQWTPWGNFDPEGIKSLEAKGIFIQLVEAPETALGDIPHDVVLEVIGKKEKMALCLAISRHEVSLPFTVHPLPTHGLTELKRLQEWDHNRIKETEGRIRDASTYVESFNHVLLNTKDRLSFQEVYAGRQEEKQLTLLKGFCPIDLCSKLEQLAQKEQWGLLIEDPGPDEKVPTLLRNPKWINVIKPLFDFIDILPGYKEMDISFFFLVFFTGFVGILIGDAGYGALFLLANLFAHFRFGRKIKNKAVFHLGYALSVSIIVWGLLTGTLFGQQWIPQNTLKPLLPWLNNPDHVQFLCFTIGAVHLTIAHLWRVMIKLPSLSFLSEVGWISMIWCMYCLANKLVLGMVLPGVAWFFLFLGVLLIIGFTKPSKKLFSSIGAGLGDLALNIVNAFSDILSYIRLFAIGLATVAVADATNGFAQQIGFSSAAAGISSVMILLLGHTINIVLAVMAVLVHGLRLNVLEFSGNHLNLEWSGFKYQPFKKVI